MKTLDVALKDLLRSFRSVSFLAFELVVPLLVSGLFYFAFGGLASDDGVSDLPTIRVQVANQDQARMGFSAGRTLVGLLQAKSLADLLQVTEAADPDSARVAVDCQEADVAIIVPADFTAAVLDSEGHAALELYQDPTLTLAPGIVKGILSQFVDTFAGAKIAVGVATERLTRSGATMDAAMAQGIATRYADWAARVARGQQEEAHALLQVRSPAGAEEEALDMRTGIISMIMSGMMVFYVFFTGAASAQSILQEEEAGTLPRLFTTPTPKPAILGGRLIANFVTLVVQVAVLLAVSALIFGIDWGEPLPVLVMALSMIVLAATFGLVVTSFLKSTRQSGIVYGGVLTMAGMIGMLGIFTANVPNASGQTFATVSLLVPQGWAVRGWESLLEGGGVGDVLSTVAVMLGLSLAFFLLGVLKFRKRFA